MTDEPLRYVGTNEGRSSWSSAAFDVLIGVASRYNGLIVYSDLAEQVQLRTGLHTRANQRNWIGAVLSDVMHRCHSEGLPNLTALVVHKHDGQVGTGYDEVLKVWGLEPIDDQLEREMHAAAARLDCYRRWSPNVPADARPRLSPRFEDTISRRRATSRRDAPETVCPTCFTVVPVTGRCPRCADD